MSRRWFRQQCHRQWPLGVTMEGSAMDELRRQLIIRGIVNVRDMLIHTSMFLRGPPGHISRHDVRRIFSRSRVDRPDAHGVDLPDGCDTLLTTDQLNDPATEPALLAPPIPMTAEPADNSSHGTPEPVQISDDEEDSSTRVGHAIEHENYREDRVHRYVRIVRWLYGDDGALKAQVQWEDSVLLATDLNPEDLTNYTDQLREAEPEPVLVPQQHQQQGSLAPTHQVPAQISDDEEDTQEDIGETHRDYPREDQTQHHHYVRIVRWFVGDDGLLRAQVQWADTIEPATNLDPTDLALFQRLQRERRLRIRARVTR